jgi:hypothetical protein
VPILLPGNPLFPLSSSYPLIFFFFLFLIAAGQSGTVGKEEEKKLTSTDTLLRVDSTSELAKLGIRINGSQEDWLVLNPREKAM